MKSVTLEFHISNGVSASKHSKQTQTCTPKQAPQSKRPAFECEANLRRMVILSNEHTGKATADKEKVNIVEIIGGPPRQKTNGSAAQILKTKAAKPDGIHPAMTRTFSGWAIGRTNKPLSTINYPAPEMTSLYGQANKKRNRRRCKNVKAIGSTSVRLWVIVGINGAEQQNS